MAEGLAGGFPIATIITGHLTTEIAAGITVGELYLLVILASVFVCTLAIQGAATRMMFSMGRDRRLPLGGALGSRQPHVQDAGERGHRGRGAGGRPDPRHGTVRWVHAVDLRHGSDLPVAISSATWASSTPARGGWPRQPAWFNLGRWGMPVNILALVYGGVMIINIALWNDPDLFGDFGGEGRAYWNPSINSITSVVRSADSRVCRRGRCTKRSSGRCSCSGRSTTPSRSAAAARMSRSTPPPARPSSADHEVLGRRRCGAASDRRAASRPASDRVGAMTDDEVAGRRAARRAGRRHATGPGAGRARARPDGPHRWYHEPQLPGHHPRCGRPLRHPSRRQRHPPARHQPRGGARGDRRGGRGRRRPGGDGVHPAGGIPRHALHQRLAGQ